MDFTNKETEFYERIENEILNKETSRSSLDTTISNEGYHRLLTETNSPKKQTIDDYDIIRTIGKGSFGKVVLAINLKNCKNYAIKIINKHFIEMNNKVDQIHVEKQILSKLSHPNIIKLYKTFHNTKKLYYVFEYGSKGDLKEYLNNNNTLPHSLAKFIIAEIVLALEYLHTNGIIHRDLKPENIVLNEKLHVKIVRSILNQIDFATAAYYGKYFDLKEKTFKDKNGKEYLNSTLLGTAEYISPEMLNDNQCGFEGDLWALGICYI
jgi:3-phosphoinositide dependent protein kinase-1